MKRFICFVLCITVMLAFAGCNQTNRSDFHSSNQSTTETTNENNDE